MDYLSNALAGPPGDKLKLATLAQLGLGLVGSYWMTDLASTVAIVGILAVVLSQVELLRLVSTVQQLSAANKQAFRCMHVVDADRALLPSGLSCPASQD